MYFSRNDMDSLIEKVSLASPLKADLYLPAREPQVAPHMTSSSLNIDNNSAVQASPQLGHIPCCLYPRGQL